MRIIVVGLGVQGEKRRRVAGSEFIAAVDPEKAEADYRRIQDVPLTTFDAALVCVPDSSKIEILTYLLKNNKHVLVEKPLWAIEVEALIQLAALANSKNLICYTAYNHRFEPHFVRMKEVIQSGELGKLYHCRLFYGNGTARLVRESPWRDQGAGVLIDLAPHLLDLMDFWFFDRNENYQIVSARCFENKTLDHIVISNQVAVPQLEFEMTLLSWRNDFVCDIFGEKGSAHIRSLCKWGPSQFILRKRVLPSGRPIETSTTLVQKDPTWELEYDYFKQLIIAGEKNDLSRDIWIHQQLYHLSNQTLQEANQCQIV